MKRYIRSSHNIDERINQMRAIGEKKTPIAEEVKQMTDSQLMRYIKENGLERDYKDAYNMRQDLSLKKIKQLLVQNHMGIHASTDAKFDLNKLIINDNYDEEDNVTVADAIDDMAYQVCRTYGYDLTYDGLVRNTILHLDDRDIFGLKCGKDYSKEDVKEAMDKYYYRMINGHT